MTRLAIAALIHESNGLVHGVTALGAFTIERGPAIVSRPPDRSALGGVLDAARDAGWVVIPTVAMLAWPSARCEAAVVEHFIASVADAVDAETGRLDALVVVMHGAMLVDGLDDVEGHVIERIRRQPGMRALPIVVVLDLHGNPSDQLAAAVDAIVAFRRNPHDDMHEAGARAVAIVARLLHPPRRGRTLLCASKSPLAPIDSATDDEPMRRLEGIARRIEADDEEVLEVAVFAGFPYAGHERIGMSICVSALSEAASVRARALAREALSSARVASRARGGEEPATIIEAIRRAPPGPVIVAEPADNIGAGAAGDGTGLLRLLLASDVGGRAFVAICDPLAVSRCVSIAPGASSRLAIGGRSFAGDAGPVDLEWRLVSRSDGVFALEDPSGPLAAFHGPIVRMGPCAVIAHGDVEVLLTSVPIAPWDLGQWRSQALAPETARVIGVKSAAAHRAAYRAIAAAWLSVDTPGPCPADLSSIGGRARARAL